jgi:hypothetical protein
LKSIEQWITNESVIHFLSKSSTSDRDAVMFILSAKRFGIPEAMRIWHKTGKQIPSLAH